MSTRKKIVCLATYKNTGSDILPELLLTVYQFYSMSEKYMKLKTVEIKNNVICFICTCYLFVSQIWIFCRKKTFGVEHYNGHQLFSKVTPNL